MRARLHFFIIIMSLNSSVATGGGASGTTSPPPPTSDRTPSEIDADPRRFSRRKKMGGVGLQDLLPRFTCTDVTADVLWP